MNKNILKTLKYFYKKNTKEVVGGSLAILILSLLVFPQPLLVKHLIDNVLLKGGDHKEIKHINIILHGGEPTYHWKFTKIILENLKMIFNKKNITYHTQIVTNGYLFTKEKVNLLAMHFLNRAQFTLDGLKEVHDQRRPLKNGGTSFNTIINNINYIIETNKLIKVDLRVNFDYNNYNEIETFLRYLKGNCDIKRINLSLGWISNTIDGTDASKYVSKYGISAESVPSIYIRLYKIAKKVGFDMQSFYTFDAMCTSKQKNSLVISPSGEIFKCLSMVGRKEGVIGQIFNYSKSMENYFYEELYEECFNKNCEFIPICHTGCRFESYLLSGSMANISACRYEDLKKINIALLKELNV